MRTQIAHIPRAGKSTWTLFPLGTTHERDSQPPCTFLPDTAIRQPELFSFRNDLSIEEFRSSLQRTSNFEYATFVTSSRGSETDNQMTGDLNNLLAATDIAMLFLDRQMRVMWFTPKVAELFNVRMTDRARPLGDFTYRLGYDDLQSDAERVLDRLIPIEWESQDGEGRWYFNRVLPYRVSKTN